MCNRYRLKATPDELIDVFEGIENPPSQPIDAEYFPGRMVPVVHRVNGTLRLTEMTWGFPPFKGKRVINNTRSEKAATSPFWKRHLDHRCAFAISSAIEWQHQVNPTTGELRKVPHAIRFRDDRIGVIAGICSWQQSEPCCSMLTCHANATWGAIHNADPDDPRMTCFLPDHDAISAWLAPDQPFKAIAHLLRPLPDDLDMLIAEPLAREKS